MASLGETLRLLRKDKGLTLKELATDSISQAFLSKVERGQSDISQSHFEILLSRLHVTYDEFKLVQNNYESPDRFSFYKQLQKFISEKNIYGISRLYEYEKSLVTNSSDNTSEHVHNMAIAYCHLQHEQGKHISKRIAKPLEDYLFSCDIWGLYELTLFNAVLFIFPDDLLVTLLRTAFNRSLIYQKILGYQDIRADIGGNTLELLLERHNLKLASATLPQILSDIDFDKLSIPNTKILFLSKFVEGNNNPKVELTRELNLIISSCYQLNATQWANIFSDYMEQTTIK